MSLKSFLKKEDDVFRVSRRSENLKISEFFREEIGALTLNFPFP